MSRSKSAKFTTRKLTDDELLASFDQGLSTLAHLAKVYDGGYPAICFLMATEVHKILTENGAAVKARGNRTFATIEFGNEHMLNSLNKLTLARVGGSPPGVDFFPAFVEPNPPLKYLKFSDWWNRDIIYRASAALPGTPQDIIPINGSPSVPFDEREKINRRDFVALLRHKMGAHQADDMPHLLDELSQVRSWGALIVCASPNGDLRSDDGTLPIRVNVIAAMMRQISHEVLVAYGREDTMIVDPPFPFASSTLIGKP